MGVVFGHKWEWLNFFAHTAHEILSSVLTGSMVLMIASLIAVYIVAS